MTAGVELDDAKLYLRIDSDAEDLLIWQMMRAAGEYLTSIGIDITTTPVPAPLKQAVLMAVADLYQTRGITDIDTRLSPAFWRLIAPYREIEL